MTSILRSTQFICPRQFTSIRSLSSTTTRLSAEKDLAKRAATQVKPAAKEFVKPIPKTTTLASEAASDARASLSSAGDIVKDAFASISGSSSNSSNSSNSTERKASDKMSDEKPNASGLTPSESKKLPVIQPSKEDQPILDAVKCFYQAQTKNEHYDIFSDTAVFVDPLSLAEGLDRIKVQYNGLAALFPKGYVDKFDSLEPPKALGGNTLLVNQDVRYYRSKDQPDAEPTKKLNSLLAITKGNDGKVIKLVEEWNHSTLKDSNNSGFLGMMNEGRKKAFAAACMPFIDQEAPQSK